MIVTRAILWFRGPKPRPSCFGDLGGARPRGHRAGGRAMTVVDDRIGFQSRSL
jgi:hypothetical protein